MGLEYNGLEVILGGFKIVQKYHTLKNLTQKYNKFLNECLYIFLSLDSLKTLSEKKLEME